MNRLKDMDVIIYDITQDPEQVGHGLITTSWSCLAFGFEDRRGCVGLPEARVHRQRARSSDYLHSSLNRYDMDENSTERSTITSLIDASLSHACIRMSYRSPRRITGVDARIRTSKSIIAQKS